MSDDESDIGGTGTRKQRDVRLIRLVRANPGLYDQLDKDYRCAARRDRIWKDIAAAMGAGSKPLACKRRWANIRDTYRKAIKKRNKLLGIDDREANRTIRFEKDMSFMTKHMQDCWPKDAKVELEDSGDEGGQSPRDVSYDDTEEPEIAAADRVSSDASISDDDADFGGFSSRKQRDVQLIRLVRANPCLYNPNDKYYRCVEKKDRIWKVIAKEMGAGSKLDACKRRWVNIRDTYRRTVKNLNKDSEMDERQRNRPIRFEEDMKFMNKFQREYWKVELEDSGDEGGQSPPDISYVDTEEPEVELLEVSEDALGMDDMETSEAAAASEIHDILQELVSWRKEEKQARADSVGSFFKNIEQTVRRMPLHVQVEAKKRISAIVFDLELSAFSNLS